MFEFQLPDAVGLLLIGLWVAFAIVVVVKVVQRAPTRPLQALVAIALGVAVPVLGWVAAYVLLLRDERLHPNGPSAETREDGTAR